MYVSMYVSMYVCMYLSIYLSECVRLFVYLTNLSVMSPHVIYNSTDGAWGTSDIM